LDNYHSLVALDTTHQKNALVFGYPSWVYKAQSSKNGKFYCLRRLEGKFRPAFIQISELTFQGYRLTNEKAIRSVKDWKRIDNGGIVSIIDAFTTRAFGDSSLIFVTDYHPLSKTLVEHHFPVVGRYNHRAGLAVPEQTLWGYIVQIASAIKAVHDSNLAVRCLELSKVIRTDKNRVRLSACSVLDVVQFDAQRPLEDLQQEDLFLLGKLIVTIATNSLSSHMNLKVAIDQVGRSYTPDLTTTLSWLLAPQPNLTKTIDDLLGGISRHIVATFDMALHSEDTMTSEFSRELENGRIVRLMAKLNTINDRPEYENNPSWDQSGDKWILKLFRDYVFHQVDSAGHPIVDLGHIISCINKLDAGSEEKLYMSSRDGETVYVASYKDLKKQVAAAFSELAKPMKPSRGF
jgi:PAB-dependent poly(A)-specific ribonuclease subunit 3